MREVSVTQAKDQLPSLIREAERGTPVEIRRRGRAVAVLVSAAEYERARRRPMSVVEAWQQAVAAFGPADEEDAGVFEGLRDREQGRGFQWP